jgi:hypothetical protein
MLKTSGIWIKEPAESQQIGDDKVRVYRRPDHNVKAAIEAIKQAVAMGRGSINLENIEIDIQYAFYLMRKGKSMRLLMSKLERTEVHLPFFLMNKDVVKPLPTESPFPDFFRCWFAELKQVYILTQFFRLSAENQQKLFLYLAHRYHYNAPFSQEENVRLGYQTSPLAMTDRNSYLRSSQTIWMQLASQVVYKRLETTEKLSSIVWIDHTNFIAFLSQFYPVVEVKFLTAETPEWLMKKWRASYKDEEPLRPFYIFLKNVPGTSKERLEQAKNIAKTTFEAITNKLIEISLDIYFRPPLPETLREAALSILTKGKLERKAEQDLTEEEKTFLTRQYEKQLLQENEQRRRQIESACISGEWSNDQIKLVLSLKSHSDSFSSMPEFKNPTNMLKFLEDKTASQGFINQVLTQLSAPDCLKPADYLKAFRQEVVNNIPRSQQNVKDIVSIFYVDSFEGLPALISPHRGKSMQNLVTVLGNLGYSPNAVRFLRTLIQGYPAFFPVKEQDSFLEAMISAKFRSLPNKMQESASSALINLNTLSHLEAPLDFKKAYSFGKVYEDFRTILDTLASADNGKSWFKLYKDFLVQLLTPLANKEVVNKSILFAIKGMTSHIQRALDCQDTIHLFIRAMQDVLEAWMLYINIHPLVENPAQVFQKALPIPPTVVHFTPYAMRSFTRVLQALLPIISSDRPDGLRIQVFNQSYFELISNMERFRQTADILISQSDAQIEECDVYFIDIHPNNAVETQLYSHNISDILRSLNNFSQDKPCTLVVDITLNSLSDDEINTLLNEARDLIGRGQLNLVLIQSLTKFSQLGLDKLSAGFLAAYNNNSLFWQKFNDQLNSLQVQEPVDALTLQFFACLTHYAPDFQKNYIEQINRNTQALYRQIVENYQMVSLPISKKILALTCNTDLNTCYLAFNSRGIFSLLDPIFNLSLEEISNFTNDMIKKLFIPLATWLDLPLTERMSIGFPLSSINECMHVIRLTVGLEEELLPKYVDLITYICFVLNRVSKPQLFFESRQDKSKVIYPERNKYFEEKVKIFKAMYPMPNKNADSVQIEVPVEGRTDVRRVLVANKGEIQITYDAQGLYEQSPPVIFYETDTRITSFKKCLLASWLAQQPARDERILTLTPSNEGWDQTSILCDLDFHAFFNARKDNCTWKCFGDHFVTKDERTYSLSFNFSINSKDHNTHRFWLVLDKKEYDESTIFINKGHEILPAAWLDTEEKWQLFGRAYYKPPIREMPMDRHRYEPDSADCTEITLEFNKDGTPRVTIKRDLLAFKLDGVSLYWRRENEKALQLEIDFWGVKNPIHARFLCLLFCYVALYKKNIPFVFVSDSHNQLTLLKENYQPEEFKEIADKILKQRERISVQFDEKRLMRDDSPVPTNPWDIPISDFKIISGSVIPYPTFMETIYHALLRE